MSRMETADLQQIDDMLAEADSLLNEMATSLGHEPVSPARGERAEASDQELDTFDADCQAPAVTSAEVRSAPDQTGNTPEVQGDSADEDDWGVVKQADPAADQDSAATQTGDQVAEPADPEGRPKAESDEWLTDEDLESILESAVEQLPAIPEEQSATEPDVRKYAEATARFSRLRSLAPVRLLGRTARLPLDLLILLDRPFCRINGTAKSMIGYAAIATLLVAIGTLLAGEMLTPCTR